MVVDYSVNFPLTDHLNLVPSEPLSACVTKNRYLLIHHGNIAISIFGIGQAVIGLGMCRGSNGLCVSVQFKYFKPEKVKSTPEVRTDLYGRDLNKVS